MVELQYNLAVNAWWKYVRLVNKIIQIIHNECNYMYIQSINNFS